MPDPRVAHCIFCDDVRQEVGNKLSLMGVYIGELIIAGSAPVVLPKFAIVVWIITDVDDPIQHVTTTVLMPPDGKEILRAETGEAATIPHLLEGARKIIAHQTLAVGNLLVTDPGMMEVMLETDRGNLRAGRLSIRFVDPQDVDSAPTVSPQPSGLSPSDASATKPARARRRHSPRRTASTGTK